MPHYRWRDRAPNSAWTHVEACDANTIKAKIPQGVILEVESELHRDRWIEVADIPQRVVGSGNSIAVRAPDGKIYSSTKTAAEELKMKYSTIRWLVSGRRGGWGRV